MEHLKKLKDFANLMPEKAGVYLFYDKSNLLLYVGKAKNLKRRVNSYFCTDKNLSGKIKVLLLKINRIEYVVTETEHDALILENNLIKNLKPKYNILLKDDKTYPWLKITNEEYPRILRTRKIENDNSLYFGPYTSLKTLRILEDLIIKVFNIRTCKLKLTENSIKRKKWKVCLEYHLKNCNGPCEGLQSKYDYLKNIEFVKSFLNGEIDNILEHLKCRMFECAEKLNFEKANEYKLKIEALKNYQGKSIICDPSVKSINVLGFVFKENMYFFNFLKINKGFIVQSCNFHLKPLFDETVSEVLSNAISYVSEVYGLNSPEILVSIQPEMKLNNINIIVPSEDEKKLKLLKFSEINALTYANHFIVNKLKKNYNKSILKLLEKVKNELGLNNVPFRCECFDISHFHGNTIVGSCVVFVNGKPSKKEYRHYNIKTINYNDDYAAIEEIVYRRYKRIIEENEKIPDLIIVDGGKGQVTSVINALKKFDNINADVLGIAKRLEEIYKPDCKTPIVLGKKSETLKFLQRIRDEAHRFANSFHKYKKQKNLLTSMFDDIKGIGEKTKKKLFEKYDDIDTLKKASFEELKQLLGKSKAEIVFRFLKGEVNK
ncbi:MAG: excinuclease ABC subunit UvrC [Bacteroidales bacterium]|nr:excinuclease ABC subunit UvrC [Bacteroidales bacterium]